MARKAREKSNSGIYHLMLRGINRQNLLEEDEDRQRFIETIGYYKSICKYKLYGYCLMNNHIHLLLREMDESLSRIIKRISSSYVYWYNQKYDRCGHLFQERYKSEVIETEEYFLTVLRYIHQNPVKVGTEKKPGNYVWSSYQEYIGTPIVTDTDFALDILSTNRRNAIELLKNYFEEKNNDQCLDYSVKISISDQDIMKYLHQLGIKTVSELQRLGKEERNIVLRKIKNIEGVTIRQLSRITGISKSVIDRL